MMRHFAVLFSLLLLLMGCGKTGDQKSVPGDAKWWEEQARWWEERATDWRNKAFHNLDSLKQVCDGSNFDEMTITAWEQMVAGTGHAAALSGELKPWARERIRLFARNPEWKRACNAAWALPEPKK